MRSSIPKNIARVLMMLIGAASFTSCSLNQVSAKIQNATSSSSSQKTTNVATTDSVQPATPVTPVLPTTQPNNPTSQSGKWQVTDQVTDTDNDERIESQAQIDFEAASQALQNKHYAQAIRLAATSYQAAPSDETRSLATYAASQLSPIELSTLESTITLPLEMAVIGQQRLNICASQQDNACIEALLPATATALDAIGDATTAERLRTMMTTAVQNTKQPVVALLLPLSGTDRRIGRAMLGAILQAAGIYHHAPLPFDLRIFDTKSDIHSIPNIMQDVQKMGAKLILGPLDIREIQATIPKLAETQTVMIGFSPNDEFLKQSPAAFQLSYTLPLEAEQLAQTLIALNARQIVAISPEDAYATTMIQQLQNNLSADTTLSTITFPATQTDLRTIAQKVAQISPDIIYLPTTVDAAERIASFLAQENLWCKTPGSVAPQTKFDTRKFTVCIGSSAWAPIADNHRHKSLTEALYLDYTDAAASFSADFSTQFNALYHRQPAVQEILPFVAISMLKTLPDHVWQDTETLQTAIQTLLRGQQYLILPSLRQITATGSQPFGMISTTAPILDRALTVTAQ